MGNIPTSLLSKFMGVIAIFARMRDSDEWCTYCLKLVHKGLYINWRILI